MGGRRRVDTYNDDVPRDRLRGASPMATECPKVVAGVTTCQGGRESRHMKHVSPQVGKMGVCAAILGARGNFEPLTG